MTAADVSVATQNLPGSQVGLTIEVPSEQVDKAFEKVLNRLAQRVRIEGFRPGKAPRAMVEARVGQAALRDEVADALLPPVVNQALRDNQIDAIDRPQVEIQELERGRPGRFVARVSVMPEVELPDLDSLTVDRQQTEVDDAMVDRRLAELRQRLAQVEPVEREVRLGDIVVADLKVLVDGLEVPTEARTATEVELQEGSVIPELLAALPGHKTGDEIRTNVTFPVDYSTPNLRGKPARLDVTIQGVKEKLVPELDDEVAQQLSEGEHKTADSLRQAIRDDLVEQASRLDQLAFEQAAVKAVVEAARIEVPHALVHREIDRQLSDTDRSLQRRGLRLDRYLEYVGKSEAEYRAELEPDAEDRIRVDLVLEELGKNMAISPSDEDVKDYMRSEAERDEEVKSDRGEARDGPGSSRPRVGGIPPSELATLVDNPVALDFFRHRLTRLKVLEGLVERFSPHPPHEAGFVGTPDQGGSPVSSAGTKQSVGVEGK
jgi:trigger factor